MKKYLISIFVLLSFTLNAKITTSIADGNWNEAGTWDKGVPASGDIVIVNHAVILTNEFDVNNGSLTINTGASLEHLLSAKQNINMAGTGSGLILNYGTLTFQDHNGYGTIHNYGKFTCNRINSQYTNSKFTNEASGIVKIAVGFDQWGDNSSVFKNYGKFTIEGTENCNFVGSVFENTGTFTQTGSFLYITTTNTINSGTIDVLNLNGETFFNNSGILNVRGKIDDFYGTTQFTNTGKCFVTGITELWGNSFTNEGFFYSNGDISVNKLTNSGIIITKGAFNNWATTPLNNGAIYCIGTGNFMNEGGEAINSTSCGHINVGCNNFVNNANVTGNMNIYGNKTGGGTYAASVTFNPYCPCDLDITYYSRDNGNWGDYGVCSGGKSVWSIEQIRPNPVYEYPKSYGNVVIEGHTIEVDADCDQPLTCDSLTLEPLGFLTIDATKTLNVREDFIIKSPKNSGATGSLIDKGTLSISGTKTVQRYTSRLNWHYLGFPVDNVSGSMFNQNNFYSYLESNNDIWNADNISGTSGWTPAGTGNLTTKMQGYIYYYYADMLEFSGNLNTGNQSIALSYTNNNPTNPEFDGWNLVCNPYPSAIDWENVTTTEIIDNCIYFYDDDGSSPYYNNYKYYIKGGGGPSPYPSVAVNAANQYIPISQAFFVRTTTNGQLFSLDNTVRTHSSQNFYKSTNHLHPDLLKLQIASDSKIDETIIRFIPKATENFDNQFDALKMFSRKEDVPNLYSITENAQNLAISTLPKYENKTVKLGFKTNEAGNFILTATELNFENTDDIYLIDKELNKHQNLKENSTYPFYAKAGNFTNRFEILFGIPEYEEIDNQISIYSFGKQINIIQQTQNPAQLTIYIYTIDGRLINTLETANPDTHITINTNGIYLVQIKNELVTTTKKVYIKSI